MTPMVATAMMRTFSLSRPVSPAFPRTASQKFCQHSSKQQEAVDMYMCVRLHCFRVHMEVRLALCYPNSCAFTVLQLQVQEPSSAQFSSLQRYPQQIRCHGSLLAWHARPLSLLCTLTKGVSARNDALREPGLSTANSPTTSPCVLLIWGREVRLQQPKRCETLHQGSQATHLTQQLCYQQRVSAILHDFNGNSALQDDVH